MKQPRSALIFLNGEHPGSATLKQILPYCQRVIAADGGWDVAMSLGLTPDTVIGDMDSIRQAPEALPPGSRSAGQALPRIIRHPPAKDWSDTELALRLAWDEGYERTVLFGGGGGRLDHLLAIHALFARTPAPDRWYTANDEIILIRTGFEAMLPEKTIISLFPVGPGEVRGRSTGLRWPIDQLVWKHGDFGLSNEMSGIRLSIQLDSGQLLLVRARCDDQAIADMLY